uniref:Uncharacterized protein n=1 Tax=Bracon brevicornis TaxID=1563983 RepID=A0A6V7LGY6_9HYME
MINVFNTNSREVVEAVRQRADMVPPSGDGFWATVELMVDGIQDVGRVDRFSDDIEDWLEAMANKVKLLHERKKRVRHATSQDSASDRYPGFCSTFECRYSDGI